MDYTSPIGILRINASSKGLCSIRFLSDEDAAKELLHDELSDNEQNKERARLHISLCCTALNNYFAKLWGAFEQVRSQIPLDIKGNDLQRKTWSIIYSLPQTRPQMSISYAELAFLVGNPKTIRPVARICGQNPIPILGPCHRVVSSSGQIGGYAFGEARKSWLLWHEGILHREASLKSNSILSRQPPQAR